MRIRTQATGIWSSKPLKVNGSRGNDGDNHASHSDSVLKVFPLTWLSHEQEHLSCSSQSILKAESGDAEC